jgi:hypothetical protein
MKRQQCSPLALATALSLLFLTACSSDPTGPNPQFIPGDSPPISFQTRTVTVALGETVNLSNLLTTGQGTPLVGPIDCVWQSSNESTASVSPDGAVNALEVGTAVITIQFEGYSTGISVEVIQARVNDPPVDHGRKA